MIASANGSMQQNNFLAWCEHFVRWLPVGQGKEGEPVFLFLDGHVSRWDIESADYLLANNIFCVLIPSHSSSWSQLNDCWPNKTLRRIFGTVCNTIRNARRTQLSTFDDATFNDAIKRSYKIFVKEQTEMLSKTGKNCVTEAAAYVGLYPFTSNCSGWNNALTR